MKKIQQLSPGSENNSQQQESTMHLTCLFYSLTSFLELTKCDYKKIARLLLAAT